MRFLIKVILNVVTTLALTLGFAWCFGHIAFSEWATDALVQFGSILGVYGDEGLEDLYLEVTLLISLIGAISIVWAATRLIKKYGRSV